jgi:hypothetical protein
MKNFRNSLVISIIICLWIFGCHPFAYEKEVIRPYYLIGNDTKQDLTISRRLDNGDYIGRIPGNVVEYGVAGNYIVAKTNNRAAVSYYIVNMINDNDYAQEQDFLVGPLSESVYMRDWHNKLHVQLIQP